MAEVTRRLSAAAGAICLSLALPAIGAAVTEVGELPADIQRALKRNGVKPSSLSIWIQGLDAAAPLLVLNPTTPRNPASVMKLMTTYAALTELGPEYRWATEVLRDGRVAHGRLQGDLILRGGGDPYMVLERYWLLLDAIRSAGIAHIDGRLIIDDSWVDSIAHPDPGEFDGKRYRTYNVNPASLLVNFNALQLVVRPDLARRAIDVEVIPELDNVAIDNRLVYRQGRCRRHRSRIQMRVLPTPDQVTVRLEGDYPSGCGTLWMYRSVTTAPQMAYGLFANLWEAQGGTISDGLEVAPTPPRATAVLRWESLTLAEILRAMNKHSNNVMSKQLLLTLAVERGGPVDMATGTALVAEILATNGVSMPALKIRNGSGLAREARASAAGLHRLLADAWERPFMPEFVAALPIAARDGTLSDDFNGSAFAGRAHLKSGTIDHVSAVAGYVHRSDGGRYAVVILINQRDAHLHAGKGVQRAILNWLVRQDAARTTAAGETGDAAE